jgi:hypothetical protein
VSKARTLCIPKERNVSTMAERERRNTWGREVRNGLERKEGIRGEGAEGAQRDAEWKKASLKVLGARGGEGRGWLDMGFGLGSKVCFSLAPQPVTFTPRRGRRPGVLG